MRTASFAISKLFATQFEKDLIDLHRSNWTDEIPRPEKVVTEATKPKQFDTQLNSEATQICTNAKTSSTRAPTGSNNHKPVWS
jgi:hypothetical protein